MFFMLSISNLALGAPKSLNVDADTITWGAPQDKNWVLGDTHTPRSVDALMEVAGHETPTPIPAEYARSMSGLSHGQVPWPLIIPAAVLKEHAMAVASSVEDALDALGDYADVLAAGRNILCSLQPSKIDVVALRACSNDAAGGLLDSFNPDTDFMCEPPVYSHATATGRLTVKRGPKILTLQREHRRILSSRFASGQMMQVDFVSLEPRVLRLLRTGDAPKDLYSDISERIGGGSARRQVKLAVLRCLYGSSSAGIADEIGDGGSRLVKEVEDYFGLKALQARLLGELKSNGIIKNHWGRPLREAINGHLLVSHFTQSTAVDVSLMGFGALFDRIKEEDLDAIPCFVLHDALLLDVSHQHIERLRLLTDEGIDIDGLGHFEVSLLPAYLEQSENSD
jgi:hypothetical protein